MIFVDTNVFVLAIGRAHPLRDEAAAVLRPGADHAGRLATSVEVLQEIMHVFLRRRRLDLCDRTFRMVDDSVEAVWGLDPEDITQARALADLHPELESRDLIHLACCQRRRASGLVTFDRALAAAWARRTGSRFA